MPWSPNSLLNSSSISKFYKVYREIPGLVDKATTAAAIAADQTKPTPARLTAAGEAITTCITISRERLGEYYMQSLIDSTNLIGLYENGALSELGFQQFYNLATLPIVEATVDSKEWANCDDPPSIHLANWASLVGALNLDRKSYRQNLHRACFELLRSFETAEMRGEDDGQEIIAAAKVIARALVFQGEGSAPIFLM